MINIHEYRLPPAREEQAIVTSMMEACWFAAVTSMMEACWIAAITRHERHLAVIKFGLSACSDTATEVSLSPSLPICISHVFVHVYIHMQYLQIPPLSMHFTDLLDLSIDTNSYDQAGCFRLGWARRRPCVV